MSFSQFLETMEDRKMSDAPPLGGASDYMLNKDPQYGGSKDTRIRVRYFVANLQDEAERLALESIMTTALTSMQELRSVGDISVFSEQSTFTKEGDALVMVKYAEVVPTSSRTESSETISESVSAPETEQ